MKLFSKTYLGCAKTQLYQNHFWKTAQSTVSRLKKIQDNHIPYNDNLCLFCALTLHLHGNQRLEKETSEIFISFINKIDGLKPNQSKGVHMTAIPILEDMLTLNILLYDIDIVVGNIIGELARQNVLKYDNIVRLLRFNKHICYVSKIIAVFQSFRYPNCDTFFSRTFNLERHLATCDERVKNIYRRNAYQIRGTLFDKLDFFGIKYTSQQKLFRNLAIFDFEPICVQEKFFKDTKTTTWIGKYVPIPVSFSSNLVEEPIFLTTLILTTSFHRLLEQWKVWRRKVKHKWNIFSLILTQQLKLSWAASWTNLPNVIIDESTRGLTWVKMIVITKFVFQLNSCRYKKNN